MAALGHSGSQTSQLMQSSVMIRDMLTPAGAAGPGAINQCANCAALASAVHATTTYCRSRLAGEGGASGAPRCQQAGSYGSGLFLEALCEGVRHYRVYELGDMSAQGCDFTNQRRGNERITLGWGKEQAFHIRGQLAVNVGQLEFVFEVRHCAQATQEHIGVRLF